MIMSQNIIAAIHAGWKGAFKGIINKVIKFMIKKGCKKKIYMQQLVLVLAKKNYNVKEDFKKKFINKNKKNKIFFKKKKSNLF